MPWQKIKQLKHFSKKKFQTNPDINKTLSPFWSWSARYSFLSAGDLITSSKRLDTDWLIVENLLNRLNITLNNFILNILHSSFVVIYSQSTLFEWGHLSLTLNVLLKIKKKRYVENPACVTKRFINAFCVVRCLNFCMNIFVKSSLDALKEIQLLFTLTVLPRDIHAQPY